MNPDPSAMKYRSERLAHLLDTTMKPPRKPAKAATRANTRDSASGFMTSSRVPDGQNVPVLDGIFFSFQAEQSFLLQGLHGSVFHEVVVMTDFCANKVVGQIRMNDACCILSIGSTRDGPGSALFFTDSKK